MENTFLASIRDELEIEWLQSSLGSLGSVIKADNNFDDLLRLAELMNVALVFIDIDRHNQVQQCALIESLIEARPLVGVVAVGDGYDSELVISAMRAGARDFITSGLRGSEVQGLVRRLITRLPQLPNRPQQAAVTLIYGAQPDVDASLIATHLGLALADKGCATLLMDIGIPSGESKAILGLECTFHFDDALRNLRRLDSSVIETAFARHESGLGILPLADDLFFLESCNSAEIFLLLGSLRQHFSHIVINACGQRDSDLVRTLVSSAENFYWYCDQSVSCNRRNLALLQRWRSDGVKLDHARLLVDRYHEKLAPDAATLARSLELPLAATFPLSSALRLDSRNQGRSLFDLAPRDALSKAFFKLSQAMGAGARKNTGILRRLREFAK